MPFPSLAATRKRVAIPLTCHLTPRKLDHFRAGSSTRFQF
jgi:hypothetical protein